MKDTPYEYSDDRKSICKEIAETLRTRGKWVPENQNGPDLIMAVGKALDEPTTGGCSCGCGSDEYPCDQEAKIAKLEAEVAKLKESAERWDALMSCERIRILGLARDGGEGRDGTRKIKHIGFELWDTFPEATPDHLPAYLVEFVDGVRAQS